MTGAFLFLWFRSSWNLYRVRFQRMRQPRYALGTIVGGLYFYMVIFRSWGGRAYNVGPLAFVTQHRASVELAASIMLFVIAALAWVLPRSGRPAIAFTRAEVQFLFPAPLTRRQLIYYKLLRWAIGTPLASAIVTFFLRPPTSASGWTFFIGISLFMMTLNVYLTGVALTRDHFNEDGRPGPLHRWLPPAIVGAATLVLLGIVAIDWPQLSSLHQPAAVLSELGRLGDTRAAAIVLWPFRALVRVPLAASGSQLLTALPAALVLFGLSVLWIVRSDTAFEEHAAQSADRIADAPRQARLARYQVRRPPFELAPSGAPETALLWKNLILLGRVPWKRTFFRVLPLIVIFGIVFTRGAGETFTTIVADLSTIAAMIVVLIGPHAARYDLREDLTKLVILKTWPVRGAALVRGEILAPLALLAAVSAVCVAGATMISPSGVMSFAYIGEQPSGPLAIFLVAIGLIAVQLVALNALAVTFPAWVRIGPSRASGLEMFGQRFLMMIGLWFALVVGSLPPAIAAAIAGALVVYVFGVNPFFVAAFVAFCGLILECYVATALVGRVLERTNVDDVELGE
jgi:hypothetical protein